jgi:acyl-CoA oxidase
MTAATSDGAFTNASDGFAEELERLLFQNLPRDYRKQLRELTESPLFDRREGLTDAETAELAYRRAAFVARALRLSPRTLARDPSPLFALHEALCVVDGVAITVLSIHYCLAAGSIVEHGQDRPELEPFLAELEGMEACGVFLATELGYGNNVASLETEAVYAPDTREFVLSSPGPRAYKFMPNTGCAVPKLAVVMARLVSLGKDRGVFPFIVRIRGRDGALCEGVRVTPLTEKPGYALDNAVTRFDGVRIPKAQLLAGNDSVLHDDGRFETKVPSRHRRFLRAMDRVQAGRVCFTSAAVSSLRAATWIAVRYTSRRLTFAPGRRDVPLLAYHNVQTDVFGALASAYALTFAVRTMQQQFRERSSATEASCFRRIAALKAVGSSAVASHLALLRERCGAVGMLSANRILQYWNELQGLITAEGDNHLMLLKVGRQLLEADAAYPSAPPALDDLAMLDPERLVALLEFREARLQEQLRAEFGACARQARGPFFVWNQNVNRTITLASAHGESLIGSSFAAAIGCVRDAALRASLSRLCSLWGLGVLERHAGFFLAEGSIPAHALAALPVERDRLCDAVAADSAALIAAFAVDNAVLRAPIAEDDYVQAYDPWADTPVKSERVPLSGRNGGRRRAVERRSAGSA